MNQWEVYVMDVAELVEGKDLELTIRTLNNGLDKYTYKRVKAQISAKLDKFADQLQVRLGRGQLSKAKFSIKLIEEVQRCPAKYL